MGYGIIVAIPKVAARSYVQEENYAGVSVAGEKKICTGALTR